MRRRLVKLTVVAAALAIALFGIPLALAIAQYVRATELRNLERVAEATAVAVAADVYDGTVPDRLPGEADDVELALYDDHGALTVGTGPVEPGESVLKAMDAAVSTHAGEPALIVAVPVTHDGDVIGVVRAATPHASVDANVLLAWSAMGLLASVAVGAVYVVAGHQLRKIVAPLEELSAAARKLGEGDFSVRAAAAAIPEIDSVGSSLNTTALRLGELVRRERSFSADASHQLRTPLAGLRFELEAAMDDPRADVTRFLVSAVQAVDRLDQIVNELLALARDSRSAQGPIDVQDVLDEVERDWSCHPSATTRSLHIRIDPAAPLCLASRAAVRQVLAVLVENAATHGAGNVTVTARDAGEVLAIDVSDEGRGVSVPESELFVRRTSSATGHGIGLALARSLAEAEGGRLRLTGAHPATFTVFLPAVDTSFGE